VHTKYGAANRQTILGMIQDSQSLADSIIKNEGDSKKARQDANASLTQSKQKILEFAKANGLGEAAVKQMIATEMKYNATDVPAKTIKVTDLASKSFASISLKAKSIKDGKVTITGNNKQAMSAIAQVTGAKLKDKGSKLTLNKKQYDLALAIANGAKVDTKTGAINGNNKDLWNKVAVANGWKVDSKTGEVKGNDANFRAVKNAVNSTHFKSKTVAVNKSGNAESGIQSIWNGLTSLVSRTWTVFVNSAGDAGNAPHHAAGGAIIGPGTGTSDSILSRLSTGEHVLTAADVNAMGGQKAVYAFRSSLHSGKTADTSSLGTSMVSKAGTATQAAFPSTITLVDANGSLLGHMRVVADQAVSQQNRSLRRSLING
jgi:hypothetical protein